MATNKYKFMFEFTVLLALTQNSNQFCDYVCENEEIQQELHYTLGKQSFKLEVQAAVSTENGSIYVFFQEIFVKIDDFTHKLQPNLAAGYPQLIRTRLPELYRIHPKLHISAAFRYQRLIYIVKLYFIWCYDQHLNYIYGPVDFKTTFAFFKDNLIFGRIIKSVFVIPASAYSDLFFIYFDSGSNQKLAIYMGNTTLGVEVSNHRFLGYYEEPSEPYLAYHVSGSAVLHQDYYQSFVIIFQQYLYYFIRVTNAGFSVSLNFFTNNYYRLDQLVGCPSSLCSDSYVDALAWTVDPFYYVFRNTYFWKLFQPQYRRRKVRNSIRVFSLYFDSKRIESNWPYLPSYIDAAFTDSNYFTYFIKGQYIWQYNSSSMQYMNGPFSLKTIFGRKIFFVNAAYCRRLENASDVFLVQNDVIYKYRFSWPYSKFIFGRKKHFSIAYYIEAATMNNNNSVFIVRDSKSLSLKARAVYIKDVEDEEWQFLATDLFDCAPFYEYRYMSPFDGLAQYKLIKNLRNLPSKVIYLPTIKEKEEAKSYLIDKLLLRGRVALIAFAVYSLLVCLIITLLPGLGQQSTLSNF
ncbi:hypothetical protein B4U79_17710 [Dinothrombium tinctorium]|uniref:Uncharacterized protein n=1 Tax=Dinothrombium tinctorium TaxID=1965070 RepID=A0A3S3S2E7_9ACAR|nr:hypothetical protein B4U79_17798 [Dinothrombium tinctorium]RWS09180.1 hypothetical protein B4U79_17710 [Dinothrombium tinctorium]